MSHRISSLLSGILLLGLIVWLAFNYSTNSPNQEAAANIVSTGYTDSSSEERRTISQTSEPEPEESFLAEKQATTIKYSHEDPSFLEKLNQPYGFSVEPFAQRLIWTSSGDETFKVANPDGTNISVIQTNFEEPYHLKIMNSFGYTLLFYTDGKLKKKVVDTQLGTESELLVLELGEQKVHGMGFDEANNALFVGDQFGQPALVMFLSDTGNAPHMKKITPLNPLLMER